MLWRLVYDGFGNHVAKTVGGVTTKYLVEDDVNPTGSPQVFDELTNGSVTRTYSYGLQRLSQTQTIDSAATTSYYGYDAGGSVRLRWDAMTFLATESYDFRIGILVSHV